MNCNVKGCDKKAKWIIEIANEDLVSFKEYPVCDEHSPDPKDLDPVNDNIRKIERES